MTTHVLNTHVFRLSATWCRFPRWWRCMNVTIDISCQRTENTTLTSIEKKSMMTILLLLLLPMLPRRRMTCSEGPIPFETTTADGCQGSSRSDWGRQIRKPRNGTSYRKYRPGYDDCGIHWWRVIIGGSGRMPKIDDWVTGGVRSGYGLWLDWLMLDVGWDFPPKRGFDFFVCPCRRLSRGRHYSTSAT